MGTTHLILAASAEQWRSAGSNCTYLEGKLTIAQAGAALRLSEVGALTLGPTATVKVASLREGLSNAFTAGTASHRQAFGEIQSALDLEMTVGCWLEDCSGAEAEAEAKVGYWLMCVFLRGLQSHETHFLTAFLVDKNSRNSAILRPNSVRRYPTGGVSEKQALILPAFLRYLAKDYNINSSFLIARRLAHTGGTFDKLRTLPGITFPTVADLSSHSPEDLPVQYFSASSDFCARDAALYRIRGETGTVADFGLMAASIMSKQISFPSEIIVLDILFGSTAFLKSKSEAVDFSHLCNNIGANYNIQIIPYFRASDTSNGTCIGNILEVWEAITLLSPPTEPLTVGDIPYEVKVALNFIDVFCGSLLMDSAAIREHCILGWQTGEVLQSLYLLWSEHKVNGTFIQSLQHNARDTLLGTLHRMDIVSNSSGMLTFVDYVLLADLANNSLNAYIMKGGEIVGAAVGGVEILKKVGDSVSCGDRLARLYTDATRSTITNQDMTKAFSIELDACPACKLPLEIATTRR